MTRALRIPIAGALVLIAAFGLFVGLTQTTISYALPPLDGGASEPRTAFYEPAVFESVISGVMLLVLVGYLIAVIRRPWPAWSWWVAGIFAIAAVAVPLIVSGLDRPTF